MPNQPLSFCIPLLCSLACGTSSTDETCYTPSEVETTFPNTADFVTVGVYTQSDEDCYIDTGRTLFFEVDSACYVWTRTSQGHDENGNLDAQEGAHDHFNAADDMSYTDGIFTWTEYGPEHSHEAIEDTCASGVDGVVKSVSSVDYYADHGGLYLRIVDIE